MSTLDKLLAEATPGPWRSAFASGDVPGAIWHPQPGPTSNLAVAESHADAALIVYLRNHAEAIAALIAAAQKVYEIGPDPSMYRNRARRDLRAALAPFRDEKR